MKNALSKTGGIIGCWALFFSCAGVPPVYRDIDRAVRENEFVKGIEAIKKGQEGRNPVYPENNAVSLYLDKGLLEHYAGYYRDSSTDLQEAERLIEEAYTKSITQTIASYIANDNTKEYPGEDYEDIYINVFNAMNYYHRGNTEGAMVEIRKITIPGGKLDMLSRKYDNPRPEVSDWAAAQLEGNGVVVRPDPPRGKAADFSNSALARYLSFLFYLGEGNADSARIEFEEIYAAFATQPHIYANPVPQAVAEATRVPAGKARLYVIGFAGLSPIKEEGRFPSIFPFFRNAYLCFPVFKLPQFGKRPGSINSIEVVINENESGGERFSLELLEDMGAVMKETFKARFSNIFFKTYIRTMLKYAAADIAMTTTVEKSSSGRISYSMTALLYSIIAKAAVDASERADIRMSRYFPGKAYIGGVNLEPGTYTVTVNYYSGGRNIARDEHRDVRVRIGALNLIETISLR